MHLVAVVPTYNEQASIGELVERIARQRAERCRIDILVVDDDSPDGTAGVVRRLQAKIPDLHLLGGPRRGLGAAYARGLAHALDQFAPDAVLQIDADLSHLPEDIPRLATTLTAGADLAVGSRYLDGNRTPADWGLIRRGISWGGNRVARHWLGLAPIHDCTAGFRLWRSALLRDVQPAQINARGYAYQVALLTRAVHAGAHIVEVPVDFPERTSGVSKLGAADLLEFARWALFSRGARAR